MEWFNIAGATMTVLMGCLGLFLPHRASQLTGLEAVTMIGRSEFRATYGGFFVMAGFVPLITLLPVTFLMLGLCWAGTAAGRIVSIFADKANTSKNWGGVGFEAVFALLLLSGTPIAELGRILSNI